MVTLAGLPCRVDKFLEIGSQGRDVDGPGRVGFGVQRQTLSRSQIQDVPLHRICPIIVIIVIIIVSDHNRDHTATTP